MSRIAELLDDLPGWIEDAPYAVGIRDEDGVVAYVNEAASSLFGIPREQLVGTSVSSYVDEDHVERVAQEFQARLRGESDPYVMKCRFPHAAQTPVYLLVLPQPIRGVDGETIGAMAVVIQLPKPGRVDGPLDGDSSMAAGARELLSRVGELVQRRTAFSLHLLRDGDPRAAALSEREWEILTLLARGARVRNVSERLDLSQNTVRSHLKSIFRKLDVSSQAELVDWVEREMSRARARLAGSRSRRGR